MLTATTCAICGPHPDADILYEANFEPDDLNPDVFSARRSPDRIHYRLVRCRRCRLVRSDPVADAEMLSKLYERSHFDYGDEAKNLQRTYGRYLTALTRFGVDQGSLLEIGCGNGFLLEAALDLGWHNVRGVEPSREAVARASPRVRAAIVRDVMRPGLFERASFDAICLFQVLDHLADPGAVLDECHRLLRPEGVVLCFNHNVEALSARLLGERSPIIDIEHTYLYSPSTLGRLFDDHGFEVLEVGSARNRYSLRYLAHLLPLPGLLKRVTLGCLSGSRVGLLALSVPLGNLYLIGRGR